MTERPLRWYEALALDSAVAATREVDALTEQLAGWDGKPRSSPLVEKFDAALRRERRLLEGMPPHIKAAWRARVYRARGWSA